MDMPAYLTEVEHAVSGTLNLIWTERDELLRLTKQLAALEEQTRRDYERSELIANDPTFGDDEGIGTALHWDTYFGVDKQRHSVAGQVQTAQAQLHTHQFSVASLAGSALNVAKQGISIVHGGLDACPSGRSIGSQALKTVIWQARNQSMHWDEGHLSKSVVGCFELLASEIAPDFAEYSKRNLAFDVLGALGWTSMKAFADDMGSLA